MQKISAYTPSELERCFAEWNDMAKQQENSALGVWMQKASADTQIKPLLEAIFGNSPYISRLLLLHPSILYKMSTAGVQTTHANILEEISGVIPASEDHQELMRLLRIAKGKLALLTAAADISGQWSLEEVTGALSGFAELSLQQAVTALLDAAHKRGEIELPNPASSSSECGIAILGMGKLGGRELNYSSDIDLMIFFERGRLNYKGRHHEQHFMNKLAHDIVYIMQERTRDGYVFRTDLRLRPDPASTPPAINTEAAYNYYESVGQNWERAAMIKARPVAGDIAAGERFLKGITPFMWRKSLDFASINDIHSIKRQMDTRQNKVIQIAGHNIKLGLGGIREIEFYVQIHQLIWGGKQISLRLRGTCETLAELVKKELVDKATGAIMHNGYVYLRTLEHRLQMIADEQTHTLPETEEELLRVACFMGYGSVKDFSDDLINHLHAIHNIYASSFQSAEKLGDEGNLVFTGVNHDPETLHTIRNMGYDHPETISEIVMGWHHGSCRATRTKRARELITELMPTLLKRLSETSNPDAAFLKFNEFLVHLPAGVQLFSLFNVNPHLLGLIADIMGSAPRLAEHLSRSPALLDAVLSADFYGPLPSSAQLKQQLTEALKVDLDFEQRMDGLRRFRNERHFQAGVHLLKRMVDARKVGEFLSDLADVLLQESFDAVSDEFIKTYGRIKNSSFGVIGLGKLGSRELTFGSDIDLVFVYDAPDSEALSDGEKSFNASVYYNRLAQRFLNALTAMGNDGRLYEVDTRLRPSGTQGALVASLSGLEHYFSELAWTFEYMAFTKARIVVGDKIKAPLEKLILSQFIKSRDQEKLRADVVDMRDRIAKEFGVENPWDIKYVRGGLIDLDFIAQYLMLRHAPELNHANPGSAGEILAWLHEKGRIDAKTIQQLNEADNFLSQLFHMLRLCSDKSFSEETAPAGLKKLLCESVKETDFAVVKEKLLRIEQSVYQHYIALLAPGSRQTSVG